jgi:carboxylesterase type B
MLISLLLLCSTTAVTAVEPLVSLKYAAYRGVPLENGITQWLGIRYAAAPLGPLRFAAPQDPPLFDDIQAANKVRFLLV